jgi:hypothetical protein
MKALGGAHLRRLVPCVAQRRQRGNSEGQLEEEKEPEPAVVPDGNPIEFP